MTTAEETPAQAKTRQSAEAAVKRAATRAVRDARREMEREFLATLPTDGCPWWCDGQLRGWGNMHDWRLMPDSVDEACRTHYRYVGVLEISMTEWVGDRWGTIRLHVRDIAGDIDAWRQTATDLRAAADLVDRIAESMVKKH